MLRPCSSSLFIYFYHDNAISDWALQLSFFYNFFDVTDVH
jgi:hypothetical protein